LALKRAAELAEKKKALQLEVFRKATAKKLASSTPSSP